MYLYYDIIDSIIDSGGDLAMKALGDSAVSGYIKALGGKVGDKIAENLDGVLGDRITEGIRGGKMADKILKSIETFKTAAESMTKSWDKLDDSAFKFGKTLGLTAQQAINLRENILKLSETTVSFGISYGKTLDEVIKLQSDFASTVGRSIMMTNAQLEDISALSAVVGDEMAVKLTSQLEGFGMSTTAAGEMMTKMFNDSVKQGISLETYTKNVTDNLKLAQLYTFKNGVEGLRAMAESATRMKIDMQQVVSLANKANTVQGAVEMGAQLQVLGGAFADFADPMALLHGSLMDMESLSDRLTEMVGKVGYFDKNTGNMEIGAFDRQRLKAASEAMGVDYEKMVESATHQAKRKEIESQMSGLGNIPEEYKELLMNTAQFQNGVAGVRGADGRFKKLSQLGTGDLKELADMSKSDSENIRDIATMLRSSINIKEGTAKELENQRAVQYKEEAELVKNIYTEVGESKDTLKQILTWQINAAMLPIGSMVKDNVMAPVKGVMDFLGGIVKFFFKDGGVVQHNNGAIQTHSKGDLITNGIPGKEFVLNSAQKGEFIVNTESTRHYLPLLRAINSDKTGGMGLKNIIKTHSDGGIVSYLGAERSKGAELQMMGANLLNNALTMAYFKNSGLGQVMFNPAETLSKFMVPEKLDFSSQIKSAQQSLVQQKMIANSYTKGSAAYNEAMLKAHEMQNKLITQRGEWSKQVEQQAKVIEKQTAKVAKATKVINGAVKVGGSLAAGVGAFMSANQQYKADGTSIMNKSKAMGGQIGAAAGATIGAVAMSWAGPIGMMIGSAAGEFIGKAAGESIGNAVQEAGYGARRDIVKSSGLSTYASNELIGLRGSYSKGELKKIAAAMQDEKINEDELDKDLFDKLKASGDTKMIVPKKYGVGGPVNTTKTHAQGGEIAELERGEFVLKSDAVDKLKNTVTKLNTGKYSDDDIKFREEGSSSDIKPKEVISTNNININLGGNVKLEIDGKTLNLNNNPLANDMIKKAIISALSSNNIGGIAYDVSRLIANKVEKQTVINNTGSLDRKKYRKRN